MLEGSQGSLVRWNEAIDEQDDLLEAIEQAGRSKEKIAKTEQPKNWIDYLKNFINWLVCNFKKKKRRKEEEEESLNEMKRTRLLDEKIVKTLNIRIIKLTIHCMTCGREWAANNELDNFIAARKLVCSVCSQARLVEDLF